MGFELHLSLSVFSDAGLISIKEQSSMSDSWGAKAAARLKEETARKALQQAADLRDRELIKHKAPSLWQELKDKIQEKANDLNSHYGEAYLVTQSIDADSLLVQSPKRQVELRFDVVTPEITFPTIESVHGLTFRA